MQRALQVLVMVLLERELQVPVLELVLGPYLWLLLVLPWLLGGQLQKPQQHPGLERV